jgi:hypothetical protein
VAFYGLDVGRLGTVLLAQLHFVQASRTLSVFAVTDEIKALEARQIRSHTVAESPFDYPPLVGLYKTHFTSPQFLAKNLANFARSKAGRKHFESVWASAAAECEDDSVNDAFIAQLVYGITVGAYEARSGSKALTGEWIVFKKCSGGNYYFTLAGHSETNDDIYERAALCAKLDGIQLGGHEV